MLRHQEDVHAWWTPFGHPGRGQLGEARATNRPVIERSRIEVSAVGPNERVDLLIDHDLVE